jgi:hypothetical protein
MKSSHQIHQLPQSRIARQRLSPSLLSALTRRDHADLTFPHGLDPEQPFVKFDNRTAFIRTAIRNQLSIHLKAVKQVVARMMPARR